ncbi:hypothetical protein PFICI_07723 [Pestalotiopsis fici W106-1]|uniref:Uncharacterized protein n=1 Tax=Pestalotiopsis fici (strain W106-1 / CGMCC3.15140) TaxID=1229662 RepID=W3X2E0_PESFW|nr:uncharacterized protein PFICI_07723 [Pestalotiopsis fici W106-1]ETS80194.1 hypothetical protein PFICI_07723 [Pestalotiopsis fici W106-1]
MASAKVERTEDGLAVIHVALFRMATSSLAEAYRILGWKVHHGTDDNLGNPWKAIERAAEATWPFVAPEISPPRERFTRQDWDEAWVKDYDILTELASPFADQLIKLYPEAKVVIVQRDFDDWWPSFKSQVLDTLFGPQGRILTFIAGNLLGIRSGQTMRKVLFGFFHASSVAGIEANARKAYNDYFDNIRAMVAPGKRLEYQLGDGWEPLCAFLDKEVPDVPFPRKNDSQAHKETFASERSDLFYKLGRKLFKGSE